MSVVVEPQPVVILCPSCTKDRHALCTRPLVTCTCPDASHTPALIEACVPSGCRCSCHGPLGGSHVVACCERSGQRIR